MIAMVEKYVEIKSLDEAAETETVYVAYPDSIKNTAGTKKSEKVLNALKDAKEGKCRLLVKRMVEKPCDEEAARRLEGFSALLQEFKEKPSSIIPPEKRDGLKDIGSQIDWLQDGYDPTNAVSTIGAREFMQKLLKFCHVDLFSCFENPDVKAEIEEFSAVWKDLKDSAVLKNESNFMLNVLKAFGDKVPPTMFDEEYIKKFPLLYVQLVGETARNLKKCRTDVYVKSGQIGDHLEIIPKILIFTRMSECLLYLEKQADGVYVCYITQHEETVSAVSYFSIFVKSNGTLVSIHNRVDVVNFGYGAFNGLITYTTESKLGFPHSSVYGFLYADGNSAPKEGLEMDFASLEPMEAFSLMVRMYLVKTKYEGKEVAEEPIYINSLMRENYVAEHGPAALSAVENSAIFAWNQTYACGIDPNVALTTSEYNDRFGMRHCGDFWLDIYSGESIPAPDYVTSALRSFEYRGTEKKDLWLYAECIGPAERMDREVYRVLRKHLAEDIDRKIQSEYRAYQNENMRSLWRRLLKDRKDRVLDWICRSVYGKEHPWVLGMEDATAKKILDHIDGEYKPKKVDEVLNRSVSESVTRKGALSDVMDDMTATKCSIFYQIRFDDWNEMAAVYGEDLPRVFKGYRSSRLGKVDNGSVSDEPTDAVGDLVSPIDGQEFSVCLGFSKNGFKMVYKDWMKEHGYA